MLLLRVRACLYAVERHHHLLVDCCVVGCLSIAVWWVASKKSGQIHLILLLFCMLLSAIIICLSIAVWCFFGCFKKE
jgi:hypothetical protein